MRPGQMRMTRACDSIAPRHFPGQRRRDRQLPIPASRHYPDDQVRARSSQVLDKLFALVDEVIE